MNTPSSYFIIDLLFCDFLPGHLTLQWKKGRKRIISARRNSLERTAGTSCQVCPQLLSLRNLLFSPTILKGLDSTLAQRKNRFAWLLGIRKNILATPKSTKHMCGHVIFMYRYSCYTFFAGYPRVSPKPPKNHAVPIHFPLNSLWFAMLQPSLNSAHSNKPPGAASPPELFLAPCDSAAHRCFPKLDDMPFNQTKTCSASCTHLAALHRNKSKATSFK